jgi:serine/threonine protein kinase
VRNELEAIARAVCVQSGYEYIGQVGEGAFKETYKAREGDVVHALKVHRPGATSERVEREIWAMLQCNHPNIARLRHLDTIVVAGHGRCLYTVEEFLGGGTLANRVAAAKLTPQETLAIGELLVSAIGHIAANDLVHRDIKLENIMLREDGHTPVIVDFGLVRALGETSLTGTWAPRGPGTPFFAPAEQLCNDKYLIDWRADQFSLAVSLAIATFGQHPYSLDARESPGEVVNRVAEHTPLPTAFSARAKAARLPALVRMAAPWPVERYRTPDALIAAWRAQREDV